MPRPFRPATAIRIVSLAPMTRPDDLVPPIANPAPMPAATVRPRNSRRFRCDIDPLLLRLWVDSGRRLRILSDYERIGGEFPWFSVISGGSPLQSCGLSTTETFDHRDT